MVWAGGRNTTYQGLIGLVSRPLNVRLRIKVALVAEPGSAGLAGGSVAVELWGCAWAAGVAGMHLYLHIAVGVAVGSLEHGSSSLAALFCHAMWRSPPLCVLGSRWPLFPSLSLSACPHGLCGFSSPQGSLSADSVPGASISFSYTCLYLLPPTSPLEPFSLWLCLAPQTSSCPGWVSMSLCPLEPVRGWGWGRL